MVDPKYGWLPDRHLGVVATLAHADQVIEQIGDLLFEYLSQQGGVLAFTEVVQEHVSQTVVERIAPIPRKVALLVADALVTLRAALEHTLFAEIEYLNGKHLDVKAAKRIEMPASRTYEDFVGWTKSRGGNAPDSLRHGGEILRRISDLQPFHWNVRPDLHPMAKLADHTNHAKHRNPAITATRLASIINENEPPRSLKDISIRDDNPLVVGDIIAETPIGTRTPMSLFLTIGINRPGTDEWPVLMNELGEIASWVRTDAIPRLITGGDLPNPALPTRYETNVGQVDERYAISLGATVPANEVISMKFGAASVRRNFVDLLLPTLGAPHRQGITAWLNHLTDSEVLDRVDRLKDSFRPDSSPVQDRSLTLQDLCDEAKQFIDAQARS